MNATAARFLKLTLLVALAASNSQLAAADATQFAVKLSSRITRVPLTGRLYVFLSKRGRGQPMQGPNWFSPEPFFGLDVKDFAPGTTRILDNTADGFPGDLSRLPAGTYQVQALFDQDFYFQDHAQGAGNLHSSVVEWTHNPAAPATLSLTLDQRIAPREFRESRFVREVVIPSELLGKFHDREVLVRAGVVLPASYHENPTRRYPVLYVIPGFGGSHYDAMNYPATGTQAGEGEEDIIRVMLSGQCKWGHHVYADSATNGPRGQSLVEELIPHVDRTFRTVAAPTARFLNGHSSGGWSSLWLQVSYPSFFGGVWSTSPDPVDFRDYQQVNLYANPPLSLYRDEQNRRRPIARRGQQPILWYESFGKMDDVLGRGGQLRSFEAVFSPLGPDGLPRQLWDRDTGRIDPEVARAWEKYDIRLVLERNWEALAPQLKGKLHIVTGSMDTFYLEGAVRQLGQTLEQLGSDAEVTIVPGADHGSVLSAELRQRIRRQIAEAYRKHHD